MGPPTAEQNGCTQPPVHISTQNEGHSRPPPSYCTTGASMPIPIPGKWPHADSLAGILPPPIIHCTGYQLQSFFLVSQYFKQLRLVNFASFFCQLKASARRIKPKSFYRMQNLTTTKLKAILKRYCFCTQIIYTSGLSAQPYQMVGGAQRGGATCC